MKKENLNKLLPSVAVFAFIAFCFAIAHTFGGTYAATLDCPVGYFLGTGLLGSDGPLDEKCVRELKDSSNGCLATETFTTDAYGVNFCYVDSGTSSCWKCEVTNTYEWYFGKPEQTCASTWVELKDITSEANCKAPTEYTITYDLDGGTMVEATTRNVPENETITLPSPTKEGFVFKHWREKTRGNTYSGGSTVKITSSLGSMNFIAIWEVDSSGDEQTTKTFEVTLDAKNGTISNPNTAQCTVSGTTIKCSCQGNSSCKITQLPSAELDGYTFGGWSTNQSCTHNDGLKNTMTINGTYENYYACWVDNSTGDNNDEEEETSKFIDIIADAGEGHISYVEGVDDLDTSRKTYTQSCLVSDTKTMCSVAGVVKAEREGFIFNGWGANSNCKSGNSITEFNFGESTTVHACWTPEPVIDDEEEEEDDDDTPTLYKVKFELNDGILYVDGKKVSETTKSLSKIDYSKYVAKKDGHTFNGWSTSDKCSNPTKTGTKEITSDTTYHACYSVIENSKENDEISTNSGTGSSLLYIVYLIGILSLCYTGYYSYSYLKSKNK